MCSHDRRPEHRAIGSWSPTHGWLQYHGITLFSSCNTASIANDIASIDNCKLERPIHLHLHPAPSRPSQPPKGAVRGDRRRYTTTADGGRGSDSFPSHLPRNYEWAGPWEIDRSPNTDRNGWSYAHSFGLMKFPPPPESATRGPIDMVRRRRWVRHIRTTKPLSSLPERKSTGVAAGPEDGVVIIGTVAAGDTLPLPLNWRAQGKYLLLRPLTVSHVDEMDRGVSGMLGDDIGDGIGTLVGAGGREDGGVLGGCQEDDMLADEEGAVRHGWCRHEDA